MQNVIINGNTYEEVQKVQIPLSDGSGNADFIDTTGATAKAENIDKGYNAYVNGELVVGTKEAVSGSSPFKTEKIGTYNWSNPEGTTVVVEGCVEDLSSFCSSWVANPDNEVNGQGTAYIGILIVADEKPTSTSGIKAIMGHMVYEKSSATVTHLGSPYVILTGAYYGGINAMILGNVSGQKEVNENNMLAVSSKEVQCATCSIYAFDVNF